MSSINHVLDTRVEEAIGVSKAFSDLAKKLQPIEDLRESCPHVCSLILRSVPESPARHDAYVKSALRIRDLLIQALGLGVKLMWKCRRLMNWSVT